MGFEASEKVVELNARLQAFMEEHIYPREHDWDEWCLDQDNLWQVPPWYDGIREKAREAAAMLDAYKNNVDQATLELNG